MKLKEYGPGIYTIIKKPIVAEMKVYDYEDFSNYGKVKYLKFVVITHVMLRATRKSAYYIIKYHDKGSPIEKRKDNIMDFKVGNITLKRYLENISQVAQNDSGLIEI